MTENKLMPPLWMAYPDIDQFSIGWRMGSGEYYRYNFWEWFDKLSEKEQKEYINLFPEPKRWLGFWDLSFDSDEDAENDVENMCFIKNNFYTSYWNKDGQAQYDIEQLKSQLNNKKFKYEFFWKPIHTETITKSCFSQWWKSEFYENRKKYCCMEQYMMSAKAKLFGDDETDEQIMNCTEPNKIKALGRKVHNFDETVWNQVKHSVVINGNYLKFSQNKELMNCLLKTEDKILVEASPYDTIWGIGMSENNEDAKNPIKWRGKNLLGFALMEVREELKRVYANENLVDYKFVEETG